MQTLVRSTFRNLVKSARKIDRSIALRSLLAAPPARAYHPQLEQFVAIDRDIEDPCEVALSDEVRRLNQGADWYVPRTPQEGADGKPSSVESTVLAKYRSTALTSENLKLAFEGVKHLSSVLQVGHELEIKQSASSSETVVGAYHEAITTYTTQFDQRGMRIRPSHGLSYDVEQKDTDQPATLRLLIAHPLMPSFFRHTVIVLTSFSAELGAVGTIINQPLVNHERVLHPLWAVASESGDYLFQKHLAQHPVMVGGPVPYPEDQGGERGVTVLHRLAGIAEARELLPGLFLGGDRTALAEAITSGAVKPEDVLVAAGNCVWGKGQLEGELESGSWLCATVSQPSTSSQEKENNNFLDIAFAPAKTLIGAGLKDVVEPQAMWSAVLKSCGQPYEGMANLTQHHINAIRE